MKKSTPTDLELRPDGWDRFDRAVTAAVKSGPKHKSKEKRTSEDGDPKGTAKRRKAKAR